MLYGNELRFFFFESDPSLSFTLVERPCSASWSRYFSFHVDRSWRLDLGHCNGNQKFWRLHCTSLAVHHVWFNDLCIWHIEGVEGDPGFPTTGYLVYAFLFSAQWIRAINPQIYLDILRSIVSWLPATEYRAWCRSRSDWATFWVLLSAEGARRERCSDRTSASLLLLFTCYRGPFASGFDTSHDSQHSIIRHLCLPYSSRAIRPPLPPNAQAGCLWSSSLRQALQLLQRVWCGEVTRGIFILLSLSSLLIR